MEPKKLTNTPNVTPERDSHFELNDYFKAMKTSDIVIDYTHFGNKPHDSQMVRDRGSVTNPPILESDSNAGSSKHGSNKRNNHATAKRNLSPTPLATGSNTDSKKGRFMSPLMLTNSGPPFTVPIEHQCNDNLVHTQHPRLELGRVAPQILGLSEGFELRLGSDLYNRRKNKGKLEEPTKPEF